MSFVIWIQVSYSSNDARNAYSYGL